MYRGSRKKATLHYTKWVKMGANLVILSEM